jgi:DNA-binding GntR family transcriptional regulator
MGSIRYLKTDSLTLTNKVYKKLRLDIITGKIPEGSRLVESSIAEEMKVSRTPVREALQKLASEGLLYPIPRVGYIVEETSEDDIYDLFHTRMSIEQLAAKRALEVITNEEIESLKRNLQKTDEIIKNSQTEKMIDLDIEFHHIIYKASRSKKLYQICKTLSENTLKYRNACIHIPDIAQRAADGHRRIYEAILLKNLQMVNESVEHHIMLTIKDIIAFVRRAKQESFMKSDFDFAG